MSITSRPITAQRHPKTETKRLGAELFGLITQHYLFPSSDNAAGPIFRPRLGSSGSWGDRSCASFRSLLPIGEASHA